jgi:hypothetical protein
MSRMIPTLLRTASLLSLAGLGLACGDDAVCGSAEDSPAQIVGALPSEQVTWENWRSSPNNDCGENGGPVSLTVDADQRSTSRLLTLCLPRPDKLSSSTVDASETNRVRIIDVFADVAGVGGEGCLATFDRTSPATGTFAFPGICDDGLHPDGYSIAFDLQVPMTITCGQEARQETMVFDGSVAVALTVLP